MALLVGIRIAGHALTQLPPEDSSRHLPELFPRVQDVARMNRTAADTTELLANAETYVTYMAIPFVLAVYQTLLVEAVHLLQRDGALDDGGDPSQIPLEQLHHHLTQSADVVFPETELALFHFLRRLRNRIVHYGGTPGSGLRSAYVVLPEKARELWVRLTGRDFEQTDRSKRMDLQAADLIPALAITKRLSRALNARLAEAIGRPMWARLVVEDYRELAPSRFTDRSRRLKRCLGLSRHHYGGLALTEEELRSALDALEPPNEKG